jgi:hypothetical protein
MSYDPTKSFSAYLPTGVWDAATNNLKGTSTTDISTMLSQQQYDDAVTRFNTANPSSSFTMPTYGQFINPATQTKHTTPPAGSIPYTPTMNFHGLPATAPATSTLDYFAQMNILNGGTPTNPSLAM